MIDWQSVFSVLIIVFVVLFLPMILKAMARRTQKRIEPRVSPQEEEVISPPPLPVHFLKEKKERVSPFFQEEKKESEKLISGDYEFHDHLEKSPSLTTVESRHLESKIHPEFKKEVVSSPFLHKKREIKKHTHHPLFAKMEKMTSLKKMVVYSEIMSPPWE